MKNVILFDVGCEDFVREALGLEQRKDGECAFGYVKENGEVKELKTYGELFELKVDEA